ncbi:hypothetical protein V8V88_09950 [Paenibacillus phytohabitans]
MEFYDSQVDSFFALYDKVGHWKSTEIFINGELMTVGKSLFFHCYRRRFSVESGEEYCFGRDDPNRYSENYFGCQWVNILSGYFADLYGYGEFNAAGAFIVDKEKMVQYLLSEYRYNLCPAFNMNKMIERVHLLPDEIDPDINDEWVHCTNFSSTGREVLSVRRIEL